MAFGQGAGFVDHKSVYLAQVFNGSCITKQHAMRGRPARGDHDGHGRGKSQRTGTGNDQHADRIDQTKPPAGLRANKPPHHKRQRGSNDHTVYKVAGHHISHALHRCFGALRLRNHLHNLRQYRCAANVLGSHDE